MPSWPVAREFRGSNLGAKIEFIQAKWWAYPHPQKSRRSSGLKVDLEKGRSKEVKRAYFKPLLPVHCV